MSTEQKKLADYLKIKEAVEKADEQTVPFMTQNEMGEPMVVGDTEQTDNKESIYKIDLLVNASEAERIQLRFGDVASIVVLDESEDKLSLRLRLTFKKPQVPPFKRQLLFTLIENLMPLLFPYINGNEVNATMKDFQYILARQGDMFFETVRRLVVTLFDLHDYEDQLLLENMVATAVDFIHHNPDLANEARFFT